MGDSVIGSGDGGDGGGGTSEWGADEMMQRVSGAMGSHDWKMTVAAAGECQEWLKCLLGRFRVQGRAVQG